ncbi:glycosyltransferase [Ensifer soli]|uniref:glycosyltransferase n=1 Tax=Ciceribacter sp. sgz301302 TaxID=3342379 RepID=UPI0035B707CD
MTSAPSEAVTGAHSPSVLFVLPHASRRGGGVSEAARLQAQALTARNAAPVGVVAFRDAFLEEDRAGWGDVPVEAVATLPFARRYGVAPGMLAALLRSGADLVHVHGLWQCHCAAVHLWSLLTGRPYVVTPHGMLDPWILRRSPRLKRLVSRLHQDRFLSRAAGVQVLTGREAADVTPFLSGQAVEVVPNPVPPFVPDPEPPDWWEARFAGRDLYLFLGRLHEKKGCAALLEAWDRLCAGDPAFAARSLLVVCGWNDGLAGVEARLAALSARHGNAVFAGPRFGADKVRTLSRARFFVLPSQSEGLPMAVLEAWAAGVPSIMTEACNLPQGFAGGAALRTGEDVASIVAALRAASALSPDAYRHMAANAVCLARRDHSADAVGAALLRLYARAAATRRRTG